MVDLLMPATLTFTSSIKRRYTLVLSSNAVPLSNFHLLYEGLANIPQHIKPKGSN